MLNMNNTHMRFLWLFQTVLHKFRNVQLYGFLGVVGVLFDKLLISMFTTESFL